MNPGTSASLAGAQAGRTSRAVWVAVVLLVMARFVGSRRFLGDVIVAVIGATAVAELSREGIGRNVKRVMAWDNAKLAAYEEELRRRRQSTAQGLNPRSG
jgi:hypothetical protein